MAAGIIGKKAARTAGISSASGTSKTRPAQTYAPGQLHYSTSASDASALASMNKIRAQQGLAPQTQVGVKAPSRSSSTGPTTVDTKTNTVRDRQGNVLATGASLSEALAKQTQLSTGSAPSVAGRPDLYATAPGANQEVKPYYEASTRTTVTPTTATSAQLGQAAAGTLGSFNKAQGLTYLDGKTFKDLQPVLSESDLIRGPNGQVWLRQGLTPEQVSARKATAVAGTGGAAGETLAPGFSVDVPDTISTDTVSALTETPVTETDFNQMLAQMQAKQDELLGLLAPGADEIATKKKINDIRDQAEKTLVELSMGLNNVEDQPIAMQFITGQQASIQRSADAKIQNMARIEKNLLSELGLEQEARKVKASVAETQLGYLQTNLDVAFKVKQLMQQQEDSVFNRTMALKTSAQSTLTTMLDAMKGMDESDLTADQQKQLQDMAIAAGIPYSLVTEGMKAVKHQLMFDNAIAGAKAGITTGQGATIDYSTNTKDIADAIKSVESNGDYTIFGDKGNSWGAYQYSQSTWNADASAYRASLEASGQTGPVPPMEWGKASPQVQDAVAQFKIKSLQDQGYAPDQIASIWNHGSPSYEGVVGTNAETGIHYDTPGYVAKVLAKIPTSVSPAPVSGDALVATQDAYNSIDDLQKTPGFNAAVGVGFDWWKNLAGSDSATFLAKLDSVKAKLTLEILPKMKGMGALSDADREFLLNSIGSLNPRMSESAFTDSLLTVKKKLADALKASGVNVPDDQSFQSSEQSSTAQSSVYDQSYLDSLGIFR